MIAYAAGCAAFPAWAFLAVRLQVSSAFRAHAVPLPEEPFATVSGIAAACFAVSLSIVVLSFAFRKKGEPS